MFGCYPRVSFLRYLKLLIPEVIDDENDLLYIKRIVYLYLMESIKVQEKLEIFYYNELLTDLVSFLIDTQIFTESNKLKASTKYLSIDSIPSNVGLEYINDFDSWFYLLANHVKVINDFYEDRMKFLISGLINENEVEGEEDVTQVICWLMMPVFMDLYIDRSFMYEVLYAIASSQNSDLLKWVLNIYPTNAQPDTIRSVLNTEEDSEIRSILDENLLFSVMNRIVSDTSDAKSISPSFLRAFYSGKIWIDASRKRFMIVHNCIHRKNFKYLEIILDPIYLKRHDVVIPSTILAELLDTYSDLLTGTRAAWCNVETFDQYITAETIKISIYSEYAESIEKVILNLLKHERIASLNIQTFGNFLRVSGGFLDLELLPETTSRNQELNKIIISFSERSANFFDGLLEPSLKRKRGRFDIRVIERLVRKDPKLTFELIVEKILAKTELGPFLALIKRLKEKKFFEVIEYIINPLYTDEYDIYTTCYGQNPNKVYKKMIKPLFTDEKGNINMNTVKKVYNNNPEQIFDLLVKPFVVLDLEETSGEFDILTLEYLMEDNPPEFFHFLIEPLLVQRRKPIDYHVLEKQYRENPKETYQIFIRPILMERTFNTRMLEVLYENGQFDVFQYLTCSKLLRSVRDTSGNIIDYLYRQWESSNLEVVEKNPGSYLEALLEPTPLKNLKYCIEADNYKIVSKAIKDSNYDFLDLLFQENNFKVIDMKKISENPLVKRAMMKYLDENRPSVLMVEYLTRIYKKWNDYREKGKRPSAAIKSSNAKCFTQMPTPQICAPNGMRFVSSCPENQLFFPVK